MNERYEVVPTSFRSIDSGRDRAPITYCFAIFDRETIARLPGIYPTKQIAQDECDMLNIEASLLEETDAFPA